jgi:hypothetical protein
MGICSTRSACRAHRCAGQRRRVTRCRGGRRVRGHGYRDSCKRSGTRSRRGQVHAAGIAVHARRHPSHFRTAVEGRTRAWPRHYRATAWRGTRSAPLECFTRKAVSRRESSPSRVVAAAGARARCDIDHEERAASGRDRRERREAFCCGPDRSRSACPPRPTAISRRDRCRRVPRTATSGSAASPSRSRSRSAMIQQLSDFQRPSYCPTAAEIPALRDV